jgi:hypothetical protein
LQTRDFAVVVLSSFFVGLVPPPVPPPSAGDSSPLVVALRTFEHQFLQHLHLAEVRRRSHSLCAFVFSTEAPRR